ncbi:hypothetical protein [Nocardia sp. CA-119907]|uniref:hypothetical protein n=1 Tax=Nocardia sp. CA-119907 TaxID=3239973 RepID=UPI003D97E438
MMVGREWTGFEAAALQAVTRQSVREFASRLGVDAKTVSNWRSRGRSVLLRPLTQRLLDTELSRASAGEQAEFLRAITRPTVIPLAVTSGVEPKLSATPRSGTEHISLLPNGTGALSVHTPPGRYFSGSVTPAVVLPARSDGDRVIATLNADTASDLTLHRAQRSIVIATVNTDVGAALYGLDRRRVRARLAASNDGAPLLVPPAYRLDDFTMAILWAVTNLDDALLDDDGELAAATPRLATLDGQPRSVAGSDLAGELSAVSQMWVGSDFCARHILSHADQLSEAPTFWAREQRGEEASTWLLFAHKYQYLQRTATMFASGKTLTRAFCIPPTAVSVSGVPERVLLLLTTALVESFGIIVAVCTEAEYTATPGFVLDHAHRAIVATWINTDRMWHADVTDQRPILREFNDAAGWARSHSILAAATPALRLHALADYLELDWSWLTTRATELADCGTSGFSQPRSRLLSLVGLNRACRFLANLAGQGR